MTPDGEKRTMTVAQWHALALTGAAPTMRTRLDGDSMRPLIRRNRDTVTIVPLKRKLMRGDVVLFEYPEGRYVVHRVYRIKGNLVRTLGDHCRNAEPFFPESKVLGLVIQAERGGKTIALDTPFARAMGRVWMAALPIREVYWSGRALAGRALRKLHLLKK